MKILLKKSFVSPVNSVRDPGLNANASIQTHTKDFILALNTLK